MRGSIVALVALLALAAGPARADRVLDGYWWIAQTDEGKLISVMSLVDGLPLGARFAAGPDATSGANYERSYNRYIAGVPNHQLEAAIEAFYADPANREITLPDAVTAVLKKLAGDTDADAFAAGLRAATPVQ